MRLADAAKMKDRVTSRAQKCSTQLWAAGPAMPSPRYGAGVATLGNLLYVAGGMHGMAAFNEVLVLSPGAGQFVAGPAMANERRFRLRHLWRQALRCWRRSPSRRTNTCGRDIGPQRRTMGGRTVFAFRSPRRRARRFCRQPIFDGWAWCATWREDRFRRARCRDEHVGVCPADDGCAMGARPCRVRQSNVRFRWREFEHPLHPGPLREE